jgi:hypothetical protein
MPNVFIGQHGSHQVAHDLMHFHQDTPGILLVEGDRLHMGVDLAPLFSPVSADCFRPLDEAAFERSRPFYIGSHEDERSVNVPRVESRIGGAEQFGFWCRLVWHIEERVLMGSSIHILNVHVRDQPVSEAMHMVKRAF